MYPLRHKTLHKMFTLVMLLKGFASCQEDSDVLTGRRPTQDRSLLFPNSYSFPNHLISNMVSIPFSGSAKSLGVNKLHWCCTYLNTRTIFPPPPPSCRAPPRSLTGVAVVEVIVVVCLTVVVQLLVPQPGVRLLVILHQHGEEDDEDRLKDDAGDGQRDPQAALVAGHGFLVLPRFALRSRNDSLYREQWDMCEPSFFWYSRSPVNHTPCHLGPAHYSD